MASDLPEHHRMTIGEHLDELRWHVLRAVIYVVVASCVLFAFQDQLVTLAKRPYDLVTQKMTDDRVVPGDGLDADVLDLVKAIRQTDEALQAELEAAERDEAKLREQIEPSTEALRQIDAEMQAIAAELAALRDQQEILADEEPTREALAKLEERRSEVLARYERVEARVARQVKPFFDRHAQLPRTNLTQISPQEYFLASLKLVIVAALFLASPLAVRELWTFISKGLYPHEKRYIKIFYPLSLAAFLAGALFGYFMLVPLGLEFLLAYGTSVGIETNVAVASYLSLFTAMILVIGLIFELPLAMTFLAMIGVMTADKYRAIRRYFLLAAFVVGAFLTPPDPVTQTLMALPMIALYELGIWLSMLFGASRRESAPPAEAPPGRGASPGAGSPPGGESPSGDGSSPGEGSSPDPAPPAQPLLKPADRPTVARGPSPAVPVLAVDSDEGVVSEIGDVEVEAESAEDVPRDVGEAGPAPSAETPTAAGPPGQAEAVDGTAEVDEAEADATSQPAEAEAEPEVVGELASEVGPVASRSGSQAEPELLGEPDESSADGRVEPPYTRYDPDAEDDDDEPEDVVTSAAYRELIQQRAAEARAKQTGAVTASTEAPQASPGGDDAAPEEGADA